MLEAHQKSGARASEDRAIQRYSGMIKCAKCGASLIAKKRFWNGEPYIEYSCNSYNRYGKQHCTPHRIHEKQVDKLVIEELSDAQLRTPVRRIIVHQNEDKSLDIRLEFNGDFDDSVSVYVESETA